MIKLLFFLLLLQPLMCHEYYLSICCIFRNDAPYLREWIEYHHMLGVDHFYLCNHLSEDAYLDVLSPYIASGLVELYDRPIQTKGQKQLMDLVQIPFYKKILEEKKDETFWLAIIDTDEFIVPKKDNSIPAFLKRYEQYGGVVINWQSFGTSNVSAIPKDRLLIEMLTKKAPQDHLLNTCFKSIVIPTRVRSICNPHFALYHHPYFHVTEKKKKTYSEPATQKVSVKQCQINHYSYRDESFFYKEKSRRIADWFGHTQIQPLPYYNSVTDLSILRFVPQLKRKLFDDPTFSPPTLHHPTAS